MLLALTSIIACSLPARGFQLQSSNVSTTAVCGSDFSWAFNSLQQSPCLVAALVDAPCNEGYWNIPALNNSDRYEPPSSSQGTANLCTCSWASYNLISACTDCQGFSNEITSWSAYTLNCAGFISTTTYYPTNETLLADTKIPFWATTNPTTWPNAKYDSTTAQSISKVGQPDVGSPTSSSTTTSLTSSSTTSSTTSATGVKSSASVTPTSGAELSVQSQLGSMGIAIAITLLLRLL